VAAEHPLLRTKLLKWLLVPLALLLTADTFISYGIALRFSEHAYDHALVEIARETSLHLSGANGRLQFDMPEAALRVMFNDPADTLYYEISNAAGALVAGRRLAAPRVYAPLAKAQRLFDGEIEGNAVRIVELHVAPAAGMPGGVVRVAETKVKRNELAREIVLSVVVPQILLIVLAGVLVWFGVVRGLSPLARLQEAVASRSYRDRSPVVAEVPGEVQPLMNEINKLLERLDNVLTMQNRFIADAAHQLKTPVAALQAQLEATLGDRDPERIRLSLAKILAGLERLSRLVSQLLALARNEPEAARTMTLAPVDLAALAFDAAGVWAAEALRHGIDLGFAGVEKNVIVQGDAVRLRELLDNLLDNAVRYTRDGGRVTVHVSAAPPAVAISDDSPTIPAHERARIFERFHRMLGSSQDGSGLGLAIAQEIARLHGGRITLSDDIDGVGNTFSVSFGNPGAT
jgi:two-component system, OmpR family, sensor histidine kinase TctE